MMYVAYNALNNKKSNARNTETNEHLQKRLDAYQATCQKHKDTIAAIQKYMPGWMPAFNINQ